MTLYWILFCLPASLSIQKIRGSFGLWFLIGLAMTFVIGLRYYVGGDWGAYIRHMFLDGLYDPLSIIQNGREPAYRLLNWIAFNTVGEIWLVNLTCASIFTAGLISFVRRLPEPFLALTVAIPYLVIVVSMGYTRQAAAIGLILFGLKYYLSQRLIYFIVCATLAALFHRTAVIFLAIAILPYIQRNIFSAILILPMVYGLYLLILAEDQDRLIYAYIDSTYGQRSSGGFIRILLTSVFAAWFILFRKYFRIGPLENTFWMWVSVVSLLLVPLAISYPTAIDRIGLYFLPLQIFVSSHIPFQFSQAGEQIMRLVIIMFFSLVMFVWLFFADNSDAWLPYMFWPIF